MLNRYRDHLFRGVKAPQRWHDRRAVILHNLTVFSAIYACLSAWLELLSSGSVKSGARNRLPMHERVSITLADPVATEAESGALYYLPDGSGYWRLLTRNI